MEEGQRIAAKAVRRVLAGVALGRALEDAGAAASPERALATELVYGTLRFLGQVRGIVRALAERPLTDASVEALLWVALYQLMHTRRAFACGRRRRGARDRPTEEQLRAGIDQRDSSHVSCVAATHCSTRSRAMRKRAIRIPAGGSSASSRDYGPATRQCSTPATRGRRSRCASMRAESRDQYLDALRTRGIAASPIGDAGVVLTTPRSRRVAGLCRRMVLGAGRRRAARGATARRARRHARARRVRRSGRQDHASRGARDARPYRRSTTMPFACDRVADNLARLRLEREGGAADAATPEHGGTASRSIASCSTSPCTASGVVRRHPDAQMAAPRERHRRLRRAAATAARCALALP